MLEAHPHAVVVFATRPAATPASLDHVERVLGILVSAGFGADALPAFQAGISFVIGHTLWRLGSTSDAGEGAYESLPRARFPRLSRAAAVDVDEEFEFGLDALLLGLEAKLRRRKSAARK